MGKRSNASDKRSSGFLIESCILSNSKLGFEIGCVLGEGWVVSRISSGNMHLDNPIEMVKIPL
jgi:hypothetical protein